MSAMEEKLIEAVRDRNILYDTSHPDYMKIKIKLKIWDEIAKEIGMQSGSEAKMQWEKLRHSLRDAIRRQKKYVRNGAAPSTLKPWKFQTEMGFLQPYMANRKKEINLLDEYDEDSNTQNYEQLENEDTLEVDSEVEHASEEREDEGGIPRTAAVFSGNSKENSPKRHVQENPSDLPDSSRENTSTPQYKIKKKDNIEILLKQSIENLEKRATERASHRAGLFDRIQPPSDPLYHFFMSMYETTKRMPPSSQHVVKNHVYKAVTDMEATLLNIPQIHTHQQSQFYQCNIQHQYDQCNDSRCSPSTPLSSIHNAPPESREERNT
ncbi:unnamed protein product [Psylliodes chrysocephalus]|uniref:MADF domain-containing protein n=1 Tax=Psylliodes chrysocephalus TaxID=3402493 RepID=A0A9P0GL86_9CUCU|nr:unnamed protein product [Psylliodes chrysocephala]